MLNGLVLIDKPAGPTSHDVVNQWRKLASTKRVGHLGTLDPIATGLLVLLTGTATRLAQFFSKADKTYIAEITLGVTSDTYDREGALMETSSPLPQDAQLIEHALGELRGTYLQRPPVYSAKKIKGAPAYKLARAQVKLELEPVAVTVKRLDLISCTPKVLQLLISCSAGTYIRSLAHDLGRLLGCGAILSELRRTAVGNYEITEAKTLDQLGELARTGRLEQAVIPAACLLPEFPIQYFDEEGATQIRRGRDFHTSPFVVPPGSAMVKAVSYDKELVAIGELRAPNIYHPQIVF
jgi:tRNA pseudouridine55 synthase